MRLSYSFVLLAAALGGCGSGSDSGPGKDRTAGQTSFASAPPNGLRSPSAAGDGGALPPAAPPAVPTSGGNTTRTVQETDLYRLEGNRLYYLNSYRGLMVFDVTDPDHPALLGRSAIFGDPIDMIVRNGVATVVIGDWFGTMDDGTPFHGSIVRGIDASDPSHIQVIGEAKLGGWVRDDRVVGDVIYAVSEDYGWWYGYALDAVGAGDGRTTQPAVVVSSVSFANHAITQVDELKFPGFTGVFNVTPNAIMLASAVQDGNNSSKSQLLYLDISDPAGQIVKRGALDVNGQVNGWGADNGRWNLDFADGKTAHVLGQTYAYNGGGGYVLSTVDFSNPSTPVLESALTIANAGWSAAARFDTNRLYLSPEGNYYGNGNSDSTPFQVYDLTSPTAPKLAGTVNVPGEVWNILPAPNSRIFALGNDYQSGGEGSAVTLHYLDVTDPAAPVVLGTSSFGEGWAWTPAAGTFKAFTMDAAKGLVVLPFSGWNWDAGGGGYNNGLQLIEFTPTTVTTGGKAQTHGWVERGIFVGNRLVSLSDLSLAVVDYTDPLAPKVMTELTLARNVVTTQPAGSAVAEISSDWWDNDTSSSQVRMLPLNNVEEAADTGLALPTINVDGVNARTYSNGNFAYIVTNVRTGAACSKDQYNGNCNQRAQQVQVLDVSNGAAVLRGKIQLPADSWGWGGWGWEGFFWYDWWGGDEVVQVGGDALAFRRWSPSYDANGNYVDSNSELYVVDLSDPDAPHLASTVIQDDVNAWWGNLKVVGDTLYTTHYEWIDDPRSDHGWVKYYLDSIDLSDRAHPHIGAKINVPGLLVGGDASDPSLVYTIDYRWDTDTQTNDLDVLRLHGSTATLVSQTTIAGWVGSTFISGTQAYMSAQTYTQDGNYGSSRVDLHAIDLSNPAHPHDRIVSDEGWGWLLAVSGDRALVTSGWGGSQALDVYQLRDGKAPKFEQTIRTRGWGVNSVSRQDDTLFLSSGYWGVQKVDLK